MESDLRHTALHTRVPIKGQISERAYEVDVHGVKTNKPMAALRFAAIALVVVAFYGAFTGDPDLNQAAVSAAKAIDPRLADYALLAFALAFTAAATYAKKRLDHHAWVECKNQKTPVKRHQIQKLKASVDDVVALKGAKWKPTEIIVASGSGFDPDALHFAREYQITCYEKSKNGFSIVT